MKVKGKAQGETGRNCAKGKTTGTLQEENKMFLLFYNIAQGTAHPYRPRAPNCIWCTFSVLT